MLSNSSSYTERIDQIFPGHLLTSYTRKFICIWRSARAKNVILKEKHQDSNLEAFD